MRGLAVLFYNLFTWPAFQQGLRQGTTPLTGFYFFLLLEWFEKRGPYHAQLSSSKMETGWGGAHFEEFASLKSLAQKSPKLACLHFQVSMFLCWDFYLARPVLRSEDKSAACVGAGMLWARLLIAKLRPDAIT